MMEARNTSESTISERRPALKSFSDTACVRCRHQKIRCSREMPSCERCRQRETSCRYPHPPDRKFIARNRARPNSDKVNDVLLREDRDEVAGNPARPSEIGGRQVHHAKLDAVENGGRSFALNHHPKVQKNRLPERELGLFLIEIYFSHFFTASLLFDYEVLVKEYHAQNIPESVLLSIYAFASLFLRAGSGSPFAKKNTLGSFASIGEQGPLWADAASQAVLVQADKPSVSKVRTCEILAVYWFVIGELDRAAIHASISRESCRLVLQQYQRRQKNLNLQDGENPYGAGIILRMRCAIWIKVCLMDNKSSNEADVGAFALSPGGYPASHDGDIALENGSKKTIPNSVDWMTWGDDGAHIQYCAIHVVKLSSLWREVRLLVRYTHGSRSPSYVQSVFELENKLRKTYAAIPAALKSDDLMSFTYKDVEKTQRNSVHLHSLYYLSLISLHSSLASAFAGDKDNLEISPSLSDSCARSVLQNAIAFTELVRKYLATTPDFSKVPCFVGYSAFITGSVHAIRMDLGENPQNTTPYAHALICGLLMSELKVYYPILEGFWQDLKAQMPGDIIDPLDMPEAQLRQLISSPSFVDSPGGPMVPTSLVRTNTRNSKPNRRTFIYRTFFQEASENFASEVEDENDEKGQERHITHGANQIRVSPPTSDFLDESAHPHDNPEIGIEYLSRDDELSELITVQEDQIPSYQFTSTDRGLGHSWYLQDIFMNDPVTGTDLDNADGRLMIPFDGPEPFNLDMLDLDVMQ